MDKENVEYILNGVLFSRCTEYGYIVCSNIDGTGSHHIEQNKPSSKCQISHFHSYLVSRSTMIKITMTMKLKCKRITVGEISRKKERALGMKSIKVCCIYMDEA
jgi:hypothetical protein